jgi:hypothetical protein
MEALMEIVEILEATPAAWPALPDGLSTAAAALAPGLVWGRIEAWVAHRWSEREVVWIVDGPGCFAATLTPATVTTTEVWDSPSWSPVELVAGPRGLILPASGPDRITADVGAGPVPDVVLEAYRRLAEYFATPHDHPGVSRMTVEAASVNISRDRSPAWLARAMDYSGAGDLLRPYRRA